MKRGPQFSGWVLRREALEGQRIRFYRAAKVQSLLGITVEELNHDDGSRLYVSEFDTESLSGLPSACAGEGDLARRANLFPKDVRGPWHSGRFCLQRCKVV